MGPGAVLLREILARSYWIAFGVPIVMRVIA